MQNVTQNHAEISHKIEKIESQFITNQTQIPRLQKWLSEQKRTNQFKFEHKTNI